MKLNEKTITNLLQARDASALTSQSHCYMLILLAGYHGFNNPITKANGVDIKFRYFYHDLFDRYEELKAASCQECTNNKTHEQRKANRIANRKILSETSRKEQILKSHFNSNNGSFCFGSCSYFF